MFIPITAPRNLSEDSLLYYNFVGKILGKGFYDKNLLKVNLNRIILKQILGQVIVLEDIKYLDYQVS